MNVLSLADVADKQGESKVITDAQAYYTANIPFMILLAPIGIVLAICMPLTLCCSKCCCEITDETPGRFIIGQVMFVLTFIAMGLAFIFLFFAFSRGSKAVNGIMNTGCAYQSLVYPTPVLG